MRSPITGESYFLMYDPHFSVPPSVDTDAALLARPWLLQHLPPASSEVVGQILAAVDALVSNVAQHARLTSEGSLAHSALLLLRTPTHVHLIVADQGPGLPLETLCGWGARPGSSLALIRDRLLSRGGTMEVASQDWRLRASASGLAPRPAPPLRGTAVLCSFPVPGAS